MYELILITTSFCIGVLIGAFFQQNTKKSAKLAIEQARQEIKKAERYKKFLENSNYTFAKWIEINEVKGAYVCSNCKCAVYNPGQFCGNCGAIMESKTNETT